MLKTLEKYRHFRLTQSLINHTNAVLARAKTTQVNQSEHNAYTVELSGFCNLNFVLNQRDNFRLSTIRETHLKRNIKHLLRTYTFKNNLYTQMISSNLNYFAHSFIDRSSAKRKDTAWIEEQFVRENTVFILFHIDRPFIAVDSSKNMYCLERFTHTQIKKLFSDSPEDSAKRQSSTVFLGVEYEPNNDFENNRDSTPYEVTFSPYSHPEINNVNSYKSWFAIDTSAFSEDPEKIVHLLGGKGQFFEGSFLKLMSIQDSLESSIIAQARSVFCWIDRNKFCATCGSPNLLKDAGSKLECNNKLCKSKDRAQNKHVPSNIHYPRVDPVAIMLIINPARTHVLLGRKKQFPQNMYSCLAGYVEAGESLEEAVRRESFEESGIYTDRVVYHSSQPWPFPSTLMMGCLAYATSCDIKVDTAEIEDAKWFGLDEIELILQNAHPDKICIPNERTIAHQLIKFYSRNKSKL